MGAASKIEWCTHTFNPWIGCTKVGPGCDHCYAEAWARRFGRAEWGPRAERVRTSRQNWRQPERWNAQAERTGERPRVFCASLADVFDRQAPHDWYADLWDLIARTPALDWLLLTKRIGNVAGMVPSAWLNGFWPSHVWLGITVTDQAETDRDIPRLLDLPAPVQFISCEPLLGPVNLRLEEKSYSTRTGFKQPIYGQLKLRWNFPDNDKPSRTAGARPPGQEKPRATRAPAGPS